MNADELNKCDGSGPNMEVTEGINAPSTWQCPDVATFVKNHWSPASGPSFRGRLHWLCGAEKISRI